MAKKKPVQENEVAPEQSNGDAQGNGDTATAVAEPPKRGRGRPRKESQPLLNDDPAFERIAELEDLGSALDVARTERIRLGAEECELEKRLAEAMTRHGCNTYGATVGQLRKNHVIKDKVKIKKPKGDGDDQDDD